VFTNRAPATWLDAVAQPKFCVVAVARIDDGVVAVLSENPRFEISHKRIEFVWVWSWADNTGEERIARAKAITKRLRYEIFGRDNYT
jgi:hypothetical protein